MAYDPHSAYEPPRRVYLDQRQQPPLQNGYGHDGGQQEQYGGYANGYQQGYDQGYGQQHYGGHPQYDQGYHQQPDRNNPYAESNGYGQRAGHHQQQTHGGGYYDEYQKQPRQQPAPQQRPGRSYDPRYQQRGGRMGPQPRGNHHGQRAQQPPVNQDYQQRMPPNHQGYQVQPRNQQTPIEPRNGYHQSADPQHQQGFRDGTSQAVPQAVQPDYDPQQQQEPKGAPTMRPIRDQQPANMAPPPRGPVNRVTHRADAPSQQPNGPKKLSMEEWKAQEKAKLHGNLSPEVIAQDNAFPTFPGMEKKPKRDDRSGGSSAMSNRPSEDHPRPSTSSSRPGEGVKTGQRPPNSRNNSYETRDMPPQPSSQPAGARPPLDRPTLESQREQAVHSDQAYQQQASGPQTTYQSQRLPPTNGLTMDQRQAQAQSIPNQHQNDYRARMNAQSARPPPENMQQHRAPPPQQQNFPHMNGGTPAQTFNAVHPQQDSRGQTNQPMHQDYISDRPSTAQDPRRIGPSYIQSLPPPQLMRSQMAPTNDGNATWQPPPKPYAPVPVANAQESLGDVYDGYRAEPPVPAKSREEEIEAEMPDFDSAAPSQTSLLYKRKQIVDRDSNRAPVPSPSGPMPQQQPVTFLNNPKIRPPQQQNLGHAPPTINEGFDFGVPPPQPQPQQYQYEDPRQHPRQRQFPEDIAPGYDARAAPPQLPYADQGPSRSMDDARQMPYRQGYSQRGGRPSQPNGVASNQYRPDMDRNFSAATIQTTYSEPAMQRVGSAPPMRPGMSQPSTNPNNVGAPLTKHRSNPQDHASNPDALPAHPTPVRPGLMQTGSPQPSKPPPVRNYSQHSGPANGQVRKPSIDIAKPVTHAELERLRAAAEANTSSPKTQFMYAQKLVEAATVLASEGGRADPKTTAKNRERYITDAHKRIKKLVSQGYPEAEFYLADCYSQGSLGLEPDPKEAFNLYQAAAKAGHPSAAFRTAVCCEIGPEDGGGTRKDYAKAVQWYRRAAALGDPAAMYKVGMISLKGLLGDKRNVTDAVNWLKKAADRADQENPHALHTLAALHEASNTDPEVRSQVPVDEKYALSLFQQAASLGHKASQFRLGQAYEYGSLGLTIDNRASISWYSKAAAQGEHQAELALSGWYLTGAEGILEHNETEAYLWARKAASSEPPLAKAMFAMGYFSEQGIGCPANMEEAKRWYGRAASYKFPKAMERLEELRRSGKSKPAAVNGKLTRKDQKRDEAECVVM